MNLHIYGLTREELVFIEGNTRDARFLSHSKKTTYLAFKVLLNVHARVAHLLPRHYERSLMAKISNIHLWLLEKIPIRIALQLYD